MPLAESRATGETNDMGERCVEGIQRGSQWGEAAVGNGGGWSKTKNRRSPKRPRERRSTGTPQRVAKSSFVSTKQSHRATRCYIVAIRSVTGIHWYLAIDATCASMKVISEAGYAIETSASPCSSTHQRTFPPGANHGTTPSVCMGARNRRTQIWVCREPPMMKAVKFW